MGEQSYLKKSPYDRHSSSESDNTNFAQTFDIPDWGIKDYIRERAVWQKGVESLAGEPGWFYFKIFFKFNTSYGLFGGIVDDAKSVNTAIEYLSNCKGNYAVDQIAERQIALLKFVGSLSYINENAPWFFNSISGLNNANSVKITEPFKNNEIEIGIREDAVDMRLTTLFELYKYACFDNINLKEIIPENLRKFDMTIIVFHTPLRYYQTGFQSLKDGTYEYKSLNSPQFGDRMSYLMFTFNNCEFDIDSINSVIPAEISNETAFNLGKSSFKIKYKRVYKHTSNEWSKMFFGDGSKFEYENRNVKNVNNENGNNENGKNGNNENGNADNGNNENEFNDKFKSQSNRIGAIKNSVDSGYYNKTSNVYKSIVDAVEKEANDIMRATDPEMALGNLYGKSNKNTNGWLTSKIKKSIGKTKSKLTSKIQNSIDEVKYAIKSNLKSIISGRKDHSQGIGSNYFKTQESLHGGQNPYMPGTPYFEQRVKKEKQGDSSLH